MLGSNQRPLPCEGRLACTVTYRLASEMRLYKLNSASGVPYACRHVPLIIASIAAALLPSCSPLTAQIKTLDPHEIVER
jgi:hypothetical protein